MGKKVVPLPKAQVGDSREIEETPIDGTVGEILEPEAGDRDGLVFERLLRVRTPLVGGGNNQTMGKRTLSGGCRESFARSREEGVNVSLLKGVVRVVEFALDRPVVSGSTFASDEVDSHIHP